MFVSTLTVLGQDDPKTAAGKLGPNPIFIIDSQRVSQSDLSKYSPDSIATVVMLYDTAATKLYGDAAKDGAVIIETRSFARNMFISFFRKSSHVYDSLYNVVGNDTSFAYIINDKVQKENYEGNLSAITDELFNGLEILTKEQLYSKYKIRDKQFGILVHSKRPKELYNGDKKF
ncbi:MAG: hypothetical protein JWN83_115 [Chitinophagaceae bacterium]|nr:hypothetical protein [Chitinophagaceae bacterium]